MRQLELHHLYSPESNRPDGGPVWGPSSGEKPSRASRTTLALLATGAIALSTGAAANGCGSLGGPGGVNRPTAHTEVFKRPDGVWEVTVDGYNFPRKVVYGFLHLAIEQRLRDDQDALVWRTYAEVTGDGAHNFELPPGILRYGDVYAVVTRIGLDLKSGRVVNLEPADTYFRPMSGDIEGADDSGSEPQ